MMKKLIERRMPSRLSPSDIREPVQLRPCGLTGNTAIIKIRAEKAGGTTLSILLRTVAIDQQNEVKP
jgi:hypothetical protein